VHASEKHYPAIPSGWLELSLWTGLLLTAACSGDTPSTPPWEIPVLAIAYYPVDGDLIDINVTGDWGESLESTRAKVDSLTIALAATLEQGSRYHAYSDSTSRPSLRYRVVAVEERLAPLPTWEKPLHTVPMTDYKAIAEAHYVADRVNTEGVKQVWLWAYHGGVVDLWESNMAGPWGDISNSDRDLDDLPVTDHTYTFYHYNYQRGLSEATENHMHQTEAVINFVDGRDVTPENEWSSLLFWGKFVGSDRSHRIIEPGCGWSHIPPNGERDYDWANPRVVPSDCADWKPDGGGNKREFSCDVWECSSLGWFEYWTQNIPGTDNGLSYQGQPLTNWWRLIGDFDGAMRTGYGLVSEP